MKYSIIEGSLNENKEEVTRIQSEGKIIYEVIRIINGFPLFFEEHILRLQHTCKLMNIKYEYSYDIILENIRKLCEANNIYKGNIKIVINSLTNKYALYFIPHSYPTSEQYEYGVKTILYYGERLNPNAKVQDNEFRNRVFNKVEEANAYEAILVDRNGNITEGSKSNIFMIKNEVIITSPINGVLPGITRLKVMKLIKELGIKLEEKCIHENQIQNMDNLFITGTSPKILPIKLVDNIRFGCNNSILRRIMKEFDIFIEKDIDKLRNKHSKGKLIIK